MVEYLESRGIEHNITQADLDAAKIAERDEITAKEKFDEHLKTAGFTDEEIANIKNGQLTPEQYEKLFATDAKIFKEKWNKLIASQERFKFFSPNPWTPFWHLKNDHFWRFVPNKGFSSDDIDKISSGITPSIGKLRKIIHCAKLEQSLYDLLS